MEASTTSPEALARSAIAQGKSIRQACAASGLTYYQVQRLRAGKPGHKSQAPPRAKPPYPPLPNSHAAKTTPRIHCPQHGPVFSPCYACWLARRSEI